MSDLYIAARRGEREWFCPVGAWTQEHTRIYNEEAWTDLELNPCLGFCGTNLSFVPTLRRVERLSIVMSEIEGFEPLYDRPDLQSLRGQAESPTVIAYDRLPALEDCFVSWGPCHARLFEAKRLRSLWVVGYKASLDRFSTLPDLESLELSCTRIFDLSFVRDLRALRSLGLYRVTPFDSLEALRDATGLRALKLKSCTKLRSLSGIEHLVHLEHLDVDDCGKVESLLPVRHLPLRWLSFIGSTNIVDGQLGFIREMSTLKQVAFGLRKHYTHTWRDYRHLMPRHWPVELFPETNGE
jgi:hypothetical protein